MSSSIEPEFNPSDDLTRDNVIKMARHYINYWKIEADDYHEKYWRTRFELESLRKEIEKITADLKRKNDERNS